MPRETCFRRRDGSPIWVVQNANFEKQRDGTVVFDGTLIDITESKLNNIAIENWKRRYDAVVLASGQIIYDYDLTTNLITLGGALREILGYSPEELQATSSLEQIHPDDRPRVLQAAEKARLSC